MKYFINFFLFRNFGLFTYSDPSGIKLTFHRDFAQRKISTTTSMDCIFLNFKNVIYIYTRGHP